MMTETKVSYVPIGKLVPQIDIKSQFEKEFVKKMDKILSTLDGQYNGILILEDPDLIGPFAATFFADEYDVDIRTGKPVVNMHGLSKEDKIKKLKQVFKSILSIQKTLEELVERNKFFVRDLLKQIKTLEKINGV